jgi:hypothetical protein
MSDDDTTSGNMQESSDLLEQKLNEAALLALNEHHQREAEADQGRSEAKRCREKAALYLEQAQTAEKRVKRLCVQSNKAMCLYESLQFDALCHALRRNDAATTELTRPSHFPPAGYAQPLGEALEDNSIVSKLEIDLQKLLPPALPTQGMASFVAPLMRFIRTSKALRSVVICTEYEHRGSGANKLLMKEIFKAVSENRWEIDTLDCRCENAPIRSFCIVVQSCTTLKAVDIEFGAGSSREERAAIENAFQSTSLKSLRVSTDDVPLVTAILKGLKVSNRKLQELTLSCSAFSRAYWAALSRFTHATKSLTHLKIEAQAFDEEQMVSFLSCLKEQSSINKLSLDECSMDSEAIRALERFMGTRKDGDTLGVSSLCEFVCSVIEGKFVPASMFWMKQVEGQLPPNNEQWYPTIGSQLRTLELLCPGKGFVRALARHAHRFCFTKLTTCGLDTKDCKQLARFISTTSLLQELDLFNVDDEYSIVCSLRSNGTLHRVTGDLESRLVHSFCLRNKFLRRVLDRLTVIDSNQCISKAKDRGAVSLVPSLLQSAKQVSASRTTVVLSSLLNLGESIGPNENAVPKN